MTSDEIREFYLLENFDRIDRTTVVKTDGKILRIQSDFTVFKFKQRSGVIFFSNQRPRGSRDETRLNVDCLSNEKVSFQSFFLALVYSHGPME